MREDIALLLLLGLMLWRLKKRTFGIFDVVFFVSCNFIVVLVHRLTH